MGSPGELKGKRKAAPASPGRGPSSRPPAQCLDTGSAKGPAGANASPVRRSAAAAGGRRAAVDGSATAVARAAKAPSLPPGDRGLLTSS